MEVADSIAVMNEGRIEQVGPPRGLYEHPVNQFVMTFMGSVNRLGETFVRPHDIELSTRQRRDLARHDRAARLPRVGSAGRPAARARRGAHVGPGHPRGRRRARARDGRTIFVRPATSGCSPRAPRAGI